MADQSREKPYKVTNSFNNQKLLCVHHQNLWKKVLNFDTKYPIILKTLRGSKGVGVLFVETERSLNSLVQTLYKMDSLFRPLNARIY